MQLIPDSWGARLVEGNDCNLPKGSEDGGRFGRKDDPRCGASGGGTSQRDGTAADYRLMVNGQSLGRVKRVRSRSAMVGGPQTYTTTWQAKPGGYAQPHSFETQDAAEEYLQAQAHETEPESARKGSSGGDAKLVRVRGLSPELAAEIPAGLRWIESYHGKELSTSDSEDDTLSPAVTRDVSVNGTVTYRLQRDGYPKRATLTAALQDYAIVKIGNRNERARRAAEREPESARKGSSGGDSHEDTLRSLIDDMGYLATEGRAATFGSGRSSPGVRDLPEGVSLAQVKKAIAETPEVDGWRFTYTAPEVQRSQGGKGASKAGRRVESSKRYKYKGAKIRVERVQNG